MWSSEEKNEYSLFPLLKEGLRNPDASLVFQSYFTKRKNGEDGHVTKARLRAVLHDRKWPDCFPNISHTYIRTELYDFLHPHVHVRTRDNDISLCRTRGVSVKRRRPIIILLSDLSLMHHLDLCYNAHFFLNLDYLPFVCRYTGSMALGIWRQLRHSTH